MYSLKVKEFLINPVHGGIQFKYYFRNGYGASIVCHPYSYGGEYGEFEIALMDHNDRLIYNESFPDVIGYLSFAQVEEQLNLISELDLHPANSTNTKYA